MKSQKSELVKYYEPDLIEPKLLTVQAYGMTFHPAYVVHGTEFMCPVPAIDNVKIFRIADYPQEEIVSFSIEAEPETPKKRRAKKVENASIAE